MKSKRKNKKHIKFFLRKRIRFLKNAKRLASKKKNKKFIKKTKRYKEKKLPSLYELIKRRRKVVWKNIFNRYTFSDTPITVELKGEIGIETNNIEDFISIGKVIVDSNSCMLKLDVSKCDRLWPSAITLICSFHQWRNLIYSMKRKNHKKVSNFPHKKVAESL